MVAGVVRMALPSADQLPEDGPVTYAVIGSLFTLGAFLTYHGYRRVGLHTARTSTAHQRA
jgi:hypothetical protein